MQFTQRISLWIGLCAVLTALSGQLGAEDKPPELTLAQYLEQMQVKLDHAAQRANKPTAESSSVVGLRGSAQEPASKQLYWKGRKGKGNVTPDEVKAFREGIEKARAGKSDEAVVSLKAFQEKFPKSALLPDVQQTLTRLSETPKP